jgi:hypothetical protein
LEEEGSDIEAEYVKGPIELRSPSGVSSQSGKLIRSVAYCSVGVVVGVRWLTRAVREASRSETVMATIRGELLFEEDPVVLFECTCRNVLVCNLFGPAAHVIQLEILGHFLRESEDCIRRMQAVGLSKR